MCWEGKKQDGVGEPGPQQCSFVILALGPGWQQVGEPIDLSTPRAALKR